MRLSIALCGIVGLGAASAIFGGDKESKSTMLPEVEQYLLERGREFDEIPDERKAQLKKISRFVANRIQAGQPARLTFVCTHNSRRSHLAQIWAAAAGLHYGIDGVETFSGGTEATAFNPRAIAAIERAGLRVEKAEDGKNPRYSVRYQEAKSPLICFSKVYSDPPNPKEEFCAVMTCSQADQSCPNVLGSSLRVAIPYEDPKGSDGTSEEASTYDSTLR